MLFYELGERKQIFKIFHPPISGFPPFLKIFHSAITAIFKKSHPHPFMKGESLQNLLFQIEFQEITSPPWFLRSKKYQTHPLIFLRCSDLFFNELLSRRPQKIYLMNFDLKFSKTNVLAFLELLSHCQMVFLLLFKYLLTKLRNYNHKLFLRPPQKQVETQSTL